MYTNVEIGRKCTFSVACRHLTLDVYKCKDTLFLQSDRKNRIIVMSATMCGFPLMEEFTLGERLSDSTMTEE